MTPDMASKLFREPVSDQDVEIEVVVPKVSKIYIPVSSATFNLYVKITCAVLVPFLLRFLGAIIAHTHASID